jgi:hypothetical protein
MTPGEYFLVVGRDALAQLSGRTVGSELGCEC